MVDYYQILGLPKFSSEKDVQKSFRKLAMQYHPDKHGGSRVYEDKFKKINAAYQVLGNSSSKALYDQKLLYGYNSHRAKSTNTNGGFTSPNTRYRKSSSFRNERQTDDKNHRTYEAKPEVKLKYTPFQRVYIKVSFGVMGLFIMIALVFNSFNQEKKHSLKLKQAYNELLLRIDQSYDNNEFYLMKNQIDSIKYFDVYSPKYDQLNLQLVQGLGYYSSSLFKKKEYKKSQEYYEYYSRLSCRNSFLKTSNSYLEQIEILLIQEEENEMEDLVYSFMNFRIDNASDGFALTNLLLRFNKFQLANDVVQRTYNSTIESVQKRYGPIYWDQLETEVVREDFLNGMLQLVFLSNNFKVYEDKVLEAKLPRLLKTEQGKEFYYDCKNINFDKNKITEQGLDLKYQSEFKILKLEEFLKSEN